MLEPAAVAANADAPMQFERQGYFRRDRDSAPGRPVFIRTVGLQRHLLENARRSRVRKGDPRGRPAKNARSQPVTRRKML